MSTTFSVIDYKVCQPVPGKQDVLAPALRLGGLLRQPENEVRTGAGATIKINDVLVPEVILNSPAQGVSVIIQASNLVLQRCIHGAGGAAPGLFLGSRIAQGVWFHCSSL